MSATLGPTRSFGRSSPVRAYWLAHCEGFQLRFGRGRRGVVEAVGFFETPDRPEVLAVRTAILRRRRLVPVDAVDEVLPAKRLLVASDSHADRHSGDAGHHSLAGRRTGARAAARSAAERAIGAAGRRLAAAGRRLVLLLTALALKLARGSRRARRSSARALASAVPVVRNAGHSAADSLRTAGRGAASSARQAASRLAPAVATAGARARTGAVGAARAVNDRLEGPLLELHRRLAPTLTRKDDTSAPGPLLPRSLRPPDRSGRGRSSRPRPTGSRHS